MYYIIGLQSFKRNFFANRIYTLVKKIYFHRSYNYNSLSHCLQNEVPILITDHVQTGNQRQCALVRFIAPSDCGKQCGLRLFYS